MARMKTVSQLRYRLIEPLRGLAATWVFLFHYQFSSEFQRTFPHCHALLKSGDRAVPMFFVISGYCLAAAADRARAENESCGRFILRRAWRIFPAYWLSIVTIIVSHWLMVRLTISQTGGLDIFLDGRFRHYEWFDWLKIVTLTQIFDQRFGLFFARFGYINGAYWTLGIEFQFYLVVALSLVKPRWFLPLTAVLSAISVAMYYHPQWSFELLNIGSCLPYWSWFALGILVFVLFQQGWTPERVFGRHAKWTSCVALTATSVAFTTAVLSGFEVERLVFASGFAAMLWAAKSIDLPGAKQLGTLSFRRRAPAQLIFGVGAMSYSLYLMHNQAVDCFRRLLILAGFRGAIQADLLCVALTLLFCYAFYRVCEAPFLKGWNVNAIGLSSGPSASLRSTPLIPAANRVLSNGKAA